MLRKNYQTKVVKATKDGTFYMAMLLTNYEDQIKGKVKMSKCDGMLAYTITATAKAWTEIENMIHKFVNNNNGVAITIEG